MNVQIKATEDFKKYLEERYPDITIQQSELIVDGTYNAFFSVKPGDIMVSILITYSPMMLNAITNYVTDCKQPVVVTLDVDEYKVTPKEIGTIIPIIEKDAMISLGEEKNGEIR